jgi:hypothetical protein
MKRMIGCTVMMGLVLSLCGWASADAARTTVRLGHPAAGTVPSTTVQRSWRHGAFFAPRHPYYDYGYYYPYRFFHYRYRQPVIILSPHYGYPHPAPATVVASSPFFCLAHQAGYISRAGMLDHLSGIHKLPLETAALVCPDENQSCIVDGY